MVEVAVVPNVKKKDREHKSERQLLRITQEGSLGQRGDYGLTRRFSELPRPTDSLP
jgi:hypothetical protein